jgi:hypothetical protein
MKKETDTTRAKSVLALNAGSHGKKKQQIFCLKLKKSTTNMKLFCLFKTWRADCIRFVTILDTSKKAKFKNRVTNPKQAAIQLELNVGEQRCV